MSLDFFKIDSNEKLDIFEVVGQQFGIQPDFVEKDIWVSAILDTLFKEIHIDEDLIFKGGTSLSKVYELTNRFSEDIDLAYNYQKFLPQLELRHLTRNEAGSYSAEIDNCLSQELIEVGKRLEASSLVTQLHCRIDMAESAKGKIRLYYPSVYRGELNILLEYGARTTAQPRSLQQATSLIEKERPELSDILPKCEEIPTQSLGRTFWEKSTLINSRLLTNNFQNNNGEKFSRHLYDLAKIYESTGLEQFQVGGEDFTQTIKMRMHLYRGNQEHILSFLRGKIQIVPDVKSNMYSAIKRDFEEVTSEMIFEEYSWEKVLEVLEKLQSELSSALLIIPGADELISHLEATR
jgi:hypothetical protein